jgi:hypothetical protein
VVERMTRWTARVLPVVLLCGAGAASAEQASRQVLGTISVQGEVRAQEARNGAKGSGELITGSGIALLERTELQTANDSAALLNFSAGGIVGLRASSTARVESRDADGSRVSLLTGEALVRIPTGAKITLTTESATIRPEAIERAATGQTGTAAEASIKITSDGQTVVRVETGALKVEGTQGTPTVVRAGEQATLAKNTSARIVAASTAQPGSAPALNNNRKAAAIGIFGGDLLLPGLLAGGAAVGTVTGLAASGQFSGSSSSSDSSSGGGGQGSPFRTPR